MEEKEIEPIIEKFVYCLRCAQRRQEQLLLGQTNAAGEIAKLLDEELGVRGLAKDGFVQVQFSCGHPTACIVSDDEGTNYCGWCQSEGIHAGRITQLQAQVAEIRELVNEASDWLQRWFDHSLSYAEQRRVLSNAAKSMEKSLSAAPELLLVVRGKFYRGSLYLPGSSNDTQILLGHLPDSGQQVKVLVVKPVKQKSLTMESKAKMIDRERDDAAPEDALALRDGNG